MIPQSFIDSRIIHSSTAMEMTDQAKIFYYMAAQDLQKHTTNAIISNRTLDFYLKRSFEADPTINYYNFYRENDPTKLKVFIENLLKYIPERNTKQNQDILAEFQTGPIDSTVQNKLTELEYHLKNTVYSLRVAKASELEIIKQITKSSFSNSQMSKFKQDLDFVLTENENYLNNLENITNDLQSFNKTAINSPRRLKAKGFDDDNGLLFETKKSPISRTTEKKMSKPILETNEFLNPEIEEVYKYSSSRPS